MRCLRVLILAGLMVLGLSGGARADYFVWRDPGTDLTVSYPDTWKIVANEQPDDILTVMPPSGRGNAVCRVRVRDDMRYAIFPTRYNDEIQQIDFSKDFWTRYLDGYKNPKILDMQDGRALGLGYAGYAEAGYWDAVPGPEMQRTGMMYASLYLGHLYILECSAHAQAYADWQQAFFAIASSVDFRHVQTPAVNGNYRNFLLDARQRFQNPNDKTLDYY